MGADTNAQTISVPLALNSACSYDELEIVKELIAARADVNARSHTNGYWPLLYCKRSATIDISRELTSAKANLELTEAGNRTLLAVAVAAKNSALASLLIESGANIDLNLYFANNFAATTSVAAQVHAIKLAPNYPNYVAEDLEVSKALSFNFREHSTRHLFFLRDIHLLKQSNYDLVILMTLIYRHSPLFHNFAIELLELILQHFFL